MGTDSLFWNEFKKLRRTEKILQTAVFAIDCSVFLYQISRAGLGWDSFQVDPLDEEAVDALAGKWAEQLHKSIVAIKLPKDNITLFFEGTASCKQRHEKLKQGRTKKINAALKRMYRSTGEYNKLGSENIKDRKAVSAVYGRPPWYLTLRVAHKMKAKGYSVSACPDTESDWRICQWANEVQKDVYVLSVDSDYLAFSPPGSVNHLAFPNQDGLTVVHKAELINTSKLTPFQLVVAFALAGSDNIRTKIHGIGWYKAVKYVRANVSPEMTAEQFMEKPELPNLHKRKNSSVQLVASFIKDLISSLKKFHWSSQKSKLSLELPPVGSAPLPKESELFVLSFELTVNGNLVRPKTAEFVARSYAVLIDPLRLVQIQTLVEAAKAPARPTQKKSNNNQPVRKMIKISEARGMGKYIVKTSKKTVTIPGVRGISMAELASGASFFPLWFDKCANSDLNQIQAEKEKNNSAPKDGKQEKKAGGKRKKDKGMIID